MLFFPIADFLPTFHQNVFVIPSLSVGNVGQLTVDLVLSTLIADNEVSLVGYLDDPNVIPVIGNQAFLPTDSMCVSLEVYQSGSRNLTILQQRGPILKNKNHVFAQNLMAWVKEAGCKEVVFLHSVDSFRRLDFQLIGSQVRYTKHSPFPMKNFQQPSGWIQLETEMDIKEIFPIGSYSSLLLQNCQQQHIPVITLISFCAEGNNVPDCLALANHLDSYLSITSCSKSSSSSGDKREEICDFDPSYSLSNKNKWVFPFSWQNLFGTTVDFYPTLFA